MNPPVTAPGSRAIAAFLAAFAAVFGLDALLFRTPLFPSIMEPQPPDSAGAPGRFTAWSAVLAFGLQIYFDFSGYTDMAIGWRSCSDFIFR